MKTRAVVAIVPLAAAFVAAALGTLLDRHAAYRSPYSDGKPEWTPRVQALQDWQAEREQKARAAAERAEFLRHLTPEKMAQMGQEIALGKGLCLNCHRFPEAQGGTQGPSLEGVGQRAARRAEGLNDVAYLAQSLYQPDAFHVPGYAGGMIPADQPPLALTDEEILFVIAYLQSLGGTPSVAPDTTFPPHITGRSEAAGK